MGVGVLVMGLRDEAGVGVEVGVDVEVMAARELDGVAVEAVGVSARQLLSRGFLIGKQHKSRQNPRTAMSWEHKQPKLILVLLEVVLQGRHRGLLGGAGWG